MTNNKQPAEAEGAVVHPVIAMASTSPVSSTQPTITTTVTTVTTITTTTFCNGDLMSAVTTTTSSTASSPGPPPTPFHFMDLPVELRLKVYEELVVVGKVFYRSVESPTYSEARARDRDGYRRPDLAILRVSKGVHREAEDVYLGQNQFMLPFRFCNYWPFIEDSDRGEVQLFSEKALTKVKHVSIEISGQITAALDADFARHTWKMNSRGDPGRLTEEDCAGMVHDAAREQYIENSQLEIDELVRLGSSRTFEINFSNSYFPSGCCQFVDDLFYIPELIRWLSKLKDIRFVGLVNNSEEEEIMERWSREASNIEAEDCSCVFQHDHDEVDTYELQRRHKISFGSEGDVWELYKIHKDGVHIEGGDNET